MKASHSESYKTITYTGIPLPSVANPDMSYVSVRQSPYRNERSTHVHNASNEGAVDLLQTALALITEGAPLADVTDMAPPDDVVMVVVWYSTLNRKIDVQIRNIEHEGAVDLLRLALHSLEEEHNVIV